MNAVRRVDVALQCLRDTYLADPCAALTVDDAAAITHLELNACHAVMEAIVDAHFLKRHGTTFVSDDGLWRAESLTGEI